MSQHLITTAARPGLCPIATCQAVVLAGVSEGLGVRVDLAPLSRDQEIAAVFADRETYSLTVDRRLVRRRGNSPVPGPVLARHLCGQLVAPAPPPPTPAAEPQAFVPPF